VLKVCRTPGPIYLGLNLMNKLQSMILITLFRKHFSFCIEYICGAISAFCVYILQYLDGKEDIINSWLVRVQCYNYTHRVPVDHEEWSRREDQWHSYAKFNVIVLTKPFQKDFYQTSLNTPSILMLLYQKSSTELNTRQGMHL